jgi:DNA repair protein RadC
LATRILNRPGIGLSSSEEEAAFFTAMEISGPGYLKELSGLGPAGQAKLLAAFELGRRYALFRDQAAQRLRKPASAPQLARRALRTVSQNQKNSPQEWLGFVPVYRSGHLGELCLVEKGVRTHVNIDPAELFARILALRPIGFFLFHNHPSGNPSPSSQDLDLTERIADISKQFGIQLLGHWVVSSQNERWIYPPHSDKEE